MTSTKNPITIKMKISLAALLIAVAVSGTLYFNNPESAALSQSTDDAYIQADFTVVAPQVSGTLDQLLIKDNQTVKAGDLLATIDSRDFLVAVATAKAQVASAKASVAALHAQWLKQETAINQAQAMVVISKADLSLAKANQKRYHNLAADGAGSVQALQQSEAQLNIQQANLQKNQAGLQAARQQKEILRIELDKAKALLDQAKAAQAAAELKLSYTQITAPINGTIGQKDARMGAYVNAGKPLLAIVPLDAIYITANFRETQLAKVEPGLPVKIEVDALPGKTLNGKVESMGPASGVSYSAVAPHNATGNFTKIVQRLPVRISIDPDQAIAKKLWVGMSVTPTISITQ
jgi:membrane fusion protein (multidrug efflux system)